MEISRGRRRPGCLTEPVAFDSGYYRYYLLRKSIRGPLVPLDGALIREWQTGGRLTSAGAHFLI